MATKQTPPFEFSKVKAMLFDVFGTLVDWRTTVVATLSHFASETKPLKALPEKLPDWSVFAQEWREGYFKSVRSTANGERPFIGLDELHREILDELLRKNDLIDVWEEGDLKQLNLVWHRLDPWPDSPIGLATLKQKYILVPLSNGSMRILIDLARHGNLPFDAIFSTEIFDTYKPDPKTYLGSVSLLGLRPEEVAMVATHRYDLQYARKHGLRTVYIERAGEEEDTDVERFGFDLVVKDMIELGSVLDIRSS